MKIAAWQLEQRQGLPLEMKIKMSLRRIRIWHERHAGETYVAFSGGKDSTVLLHLVRSLYPDTPAVFIDTGLEWPEVKAFVRTVPEVTTIRPVMSYPQVLERCGYPVVSKETAQYIREARTTKSAKLRAKRMDFGQPGAIPKKWRFLLDAPFGISEKCCDVMKKRPSRKYERESGRAPYIGTMAVDSGLRKQAYMRTGCNSFNLGRPRSTPLAFWTEEDIWRYIKTLDIGYSEIYDKGMCRTGCVFCGFGAHLDGGQRFRVLERLHPKIYAYCMDTLGLGDVLNFIKGDQLELEL